MLSILKVHLATTLLFRSIFCVDSVGTSLWNGVSTLSSVKQFTTDFLEKHLPANLSILHQSEQKVVKIKTLSVIETNRYMDLFPSLSVCFTIPSVWPQISMILVTSDVKIHNDATEVCNLRDEM